jgi:hypothetical protein
MDGITTLQSNEELMEGVKKWVRSQVTHFFDTGKHISPILTKCHNSGGDYVEK